MDAVVKLRKLLRRSERRASGCTKRYRWWWRWRWISRFNHVSLLPFIPLLNFYSINTRNFSTSKLLKALPFEHPASVLSSEFQESQHKMITYYTSKASSIKKTLKMFSLLLLHRDFKFGTFIVENLRRALNIWIRSAKNSSNNFLTHHERWI